MEFGQLHHIEYYVNDLPQTKEFWGWFLERMDYSEYQVWESGVSYAHKNETYIVFVLVDEKYRDLINNRQAAGLNHIAFQGISPNALHELANELKLKKINILSQKSDYLCFEDPNQFAVEIFC